MWELLTGGNPVISMPERKWQQTEGNTSKKLPDCIGEGRKVCRTRAGSQQCEQEGFAGNSKQLLPKWGSFWKRCQKRARKHLDAREQGS